MLKTLPVNSSSEKSKEPVIPVIHEAQLVPAQASRPGASRRRVDLLDGYIICFSGPRGGMKTISLTYLGICAKAGGLNIYSNYPIKFILAKRTGERVLMESELIDMKSLIMEADKFHDGIVLLDEYQDIAGAYSFQSIKNRILAAHWARIRKQRMSLAYTSKYVDWADTRTRDELDIEIACRDVSRLPWGEKRHGKGEKALWQCKDLSGLWTGYPYRDYPQTIDSLVYLKPIWGSYDTNFSVDVWESMRGVDLDLEKISVSDRAEPTATINIDLTRTKLISMFEKKNKWSTVEFWQQLNIDQYDRVNRQAVTNLMDTLGIVSGPNRSFIRDYAMAD